MWAGARSLRARIAIVTQEPILFNETVRDNIAYGNPKADEARIVAAAQAAYAHDFIQRFPKGYDTVSRCRPSASKNGSEK